MYQISETDSSFVTDNGSVETPLLTLRSEYGGVSQIAIDDHCYVLYNGVARFDEDGNFKDSNQIFSKTYHWYKEAMLALFRYKEIESEIITCRKMGFFDAADIRISSQKIELS